jgi:hypothetical protein
LGYIASSLAYIFRKVAGSRAAHAKKLGQTQRRWLGLRMHLVPTASMLSPTLYSTSPLSQWFPASGYLCQPRHRHV